MAHALKLKKTEPKNKKPELELVVNNVVDSLMNEGLVEVFKHQNGSLIDESQWYLDGELDGSMNYQGLKQRLGYLVRKIRNLYQKKEDFSIQELECFSTQELEWFREGNDPNYVALIS